MFSYWPNRMGWRQKVLKPLCTFMLLSWWCPLGQGKGHLPAKEYMLVDRLVSILTHLSSHWTVPLTRKFRQRLTKTHSFEAQTFSLTFATLHYINGVTTHESSIKTGSCTHLHTCIQQKIELTVNVTANSLATFSYLIQIKYPQSRVEGL